MSSALDDILAASDSDSDTNIGDIRLEDILNDDDDDDDDYYNNEQPSILTTSQQPTSNPISSQLNTTTTTPTIKSESDTDSDSASPTLEDILAANDDDDDDDDDDDEQEEVVQQTQTQTEYTASTTTTTTTTTPIPTPSTSTSNHHNTGNPFSSSTTPTIPTSLTSTNSNEYKDNTTNSSPSYSSSSYSSSTSTNTTSTSFKQPARLRRASSSNSRALQEAEARMKKMLLNDEGPEHVLSPLAVKRRYLKRKSSSNTGNNTNRGTKFPSSSSSPNSAVGVVATQKLEKISAQLAKNAQYKQHGPGLPTTVSIHSKYIAIGTSHGLILVFDHFQEVRVVLGSKQAGQFGAVTAIDMSPSQDLLVSGFMNGMVRMWDIITGEPLKSVPDVHASPVMSARFWLNKTPSTVTVDQDGRIMLLLFRKGFIGWSLEKKCLLDGKNGKTIAALDVLPAPPSNWPKECMNASSWGAKEFSEMGLSANNHKNKNKNTNPIDICSMIAFSSYSDTFIVGLNPAPRILFKFPKPSTASTEDHCSCLSWGWIGSRIWPTSASTTTSASPTTTPTTPTTTTPSTSSTTNNSKNDQRQGAVLARAWGKTIELYAVDSERSHPLPNWSVADPPAIAEARASAVCLGQTYQTESNIVALEWLNEKILLYMNSDFELCVLSVGKEMNIVEKISVANVNMVYTTPRPPPSIENTSTAGATEDNTGTSTGGAVASNSIANEAKRVALERAHGVKSFQNTFRSMDQRLYLLGRRELQVARVQTWMERVRQLKSAGEWIEALLLALDHHSDIHRMTNLQQIHANSATTSKHPDDADIADLLMEYVDISLGGETSQAAGVLTFKIIGEVCIDYCASINRTDMLFGPIFDRFSAGK